MSDDGTASSGNRVCPQSIDGGETGRLRVCGGREVSTPTAPSEPHLSLEVLRSLRFCIVATHCCSLPVNAALIHRQHHLCRTVTSALVDQRAGSMGSLHAEDSSIVNPPGATPALRGKLKQRRSRKACQHCHTRTNQRLAHTRTR